MSDASAAQRHVPLIDAIWGSWGSGAFYREAAKAHWLSVAVALAFCLALVAAVSAVASRGTYARWFDRFYDTHGSRLPTLSIGPNMIASATGAPLPFVHRFEASDTALVIATEGGAYDISGYGQAVVATTDELTIRNALGEWRMPWREGVGLLRLALGPPRFRRIPCWRPGGGC